MSIYLLLTMFFLMFKWNFLYFRYQFVAIASQLTATGCQKAAALLYCPLPSTDKISPLSLPE